MNGMAMPTASAALRITDASKIAEARRMITEQAALAGWNAKHGSRAALVATELATNLLRHAREGVLSLHVRGAALQLLAVDRGPGIADIARCLQDGYSTAGSAGTGLGAIQRLSQRFELMSEPGKGTVVLAELGNPLPAAEGFSFGGLSVPRGGESACGDGWACRKQDGRFYLLVCDGLGHGGMAAQATQLAIREFRAARLDDVAVVMAGIHEALRPTRGAAASLAVIDVETARLHYCGVGNVSGSILRNGQVRHLVTHNGILGHSAARIARFDYDWLPGSLLLMHTDGLGTRWNPADWPGLWLRDPALIAGVFYRDGVRGTDDATVVAVTAP